MTKKSTPKPKARPSKRDTTTRQAQAETLPKNAADFKKLADNANDGIVVVARDGHHLYANKAAAAISGYSISEMLKIGIDQIIHADDLPKVKKRIERRRSGRSRSSRYETTIVRKNGKTLPIEASVAEMVWNGQAADVGTIRDITKRKSIEKALRESEARYRAVVEDQIELICRFLPDGTITFVNKAFCRYLGKKWNDFVGQSLLQFHPKAHRTHLKALLSTLSFESPATVHEHVFHPSEGKTVWQKWTLQAITDRKAGSTEFQAVGQDITELKEMEEALKKANDELEGLVEKRTRELQVSNGELREMNMALKTLVRSFDKDKEEELERIGLIIRAKILPYVEDVRSTLKSEQSKAKLDAIAHQLNALISSGKYGTKTLDYLTPTEMTVASMIVNDLTSDEIARELRVTYETVKSHRKNIRKKLNIQNKRTNLTSYLKSLLEST